MYVVKVVIPNSRGRPTPAAPLMMTPEVRPGAAHVWMRGADTCPTGATGVTAATRAMQRLQNCHKPSRMLRRMKVMM